MNGKNREAWVYESIHRTMAGANALLDANAIVAMIKRSPVIIIRSKLVSSLAASHLHVSFFIICKVKLLFATSSPMHLEDGCW